MGLKMSEILLILAALLLLFGASRLPQLGSSLGSAIRNFKKGFAGDGEGEGANQPGNANGGTGQIAQSTGATAPQGDKAKQS